MSKKLCEEEVAELRREGFGTDSSARGRLLAVLDLLVRYTDEREGLSAQEIARVLGECSGDRASENAVLGDLHALARCRPLGIDVQVPGRGENTGFRCVERPLTSGEAILLIDLVESCKFIDEAGRNALREKLERFVADSAHEEAEGTILVDFAGTGGDQDVLDVVRTASKAIADNSMISFRYENRGLDGNPIEEPLHVEDPVQLIFSFGNYYLETCVELPGDDYVARYRRLDHMAEATVTDRRLNNPEAVRSLRASVVRDVGTRIDMWGDGTTRLLFLKTRGSHARYVYDRFGRGVGFQHIDAAGDYGYACVAVQLSRTFYRWLFGMGDGIVLARPQGSRWAQAFPVVARYGKGYKELLSDYEAAVDGFRSMIEHAAAIYS